MLVGQTHYYQPMWTMVGGGMKTVEQSGRPMKDVLPTAADWIQDHVVSLAVLAEGSTRTGEGNSSDLELN